MPEKHAEWCRILDIELSETSTLVANQKQTAYNSRHLGAVLEKVSDDSFLQMKSVLSLKQDDGIFSVKHVARNFLPAVGGKPVHHKASRLCPLQQRGIDLI